MNLESCRSWQGTWTTSRHQRGTFAGLVQAGGHMSLQKGRSSCSVHNGLERVKLQAVRLLRKMVLEGTVVGGEK